MPGVRLTSSNCYSSGSEHESSSLFLSEMVNEYMEDDDHCHTCQTHRVAPAPIDGEAKLSQELNLVLSEKCDDSELVVKLLMDVLTVDKEQAEKSDDPSVHGQRQIMSSLRAMGYNAAVCKSKWNHYKGEYSYIDVLMEPNKRFIVDTQFHIQFEIARPSEQYLSILSRIPQVFVGGPAKLEKLLRVIADAMKLSLKRQDLLLPPWRKPDYLRAKWFSTYKRTTNPSPPPPKSSVEADWQLPIPGPTARKPPARAPPELAKLLTEAGLIQRSQLVAVAM